MKKIFALLLSLLMLLSTAGCEKENEGDTTPTESGPSVTIDPSTIDWGYDAQKDEYDRWYLVDTDDVTYIYFALESANSTPTYKLVKSGVVVESSPCTITEENHLIPIEESTSEFDFVFQDSFNAFDYSTGEWYSRGDVVELTQEFAGKEFVEVEDSTNTIIFNDDYTCTENYNSIAYPGTWEITSKKTIKCTFEENICPFKIQYDADGYVASIEYDSRIFTTDTSDREVNKYK